MRYLVFIGLLLVCFSCNDGDVIEVELEFDQELSLCGDINSDNYLVYDTKTDPNESLMLLFSTSNNLIFTPTETPYEGSLNINGSSVRFNYRTYSGDPNQIICEDIPSAEVSIIDDYEAESGEIKYISTYTDEDNIRTVTIVFTVTNSDIGILSADTIPIGTYTHSYELE